MPDAGRVLLPACDSSRTVMRQHISAARLFREGSPSRVSKPIHLDASHTKRDNAQGHSCPACLASRCMYIHVHIHWADRRGFEGSDTSHHMGVRFCQGGGPATPDTPAHLYSTLITAAEHRMSLVDSVPCACSHTPWEYMHIHICVNVQERSSSHTRSASDRHSKLPQVSDRLGGERPAGPFIARETFTMQSGAHTLVRSRGVDRHVAKRLLSPHHLMAMPWPTITAGGPPAVRRGSTVSVTNAIMRTSTPRWDSPPGAAKL